MSIRQHASTDLNTLQFDLDKVVVLAGRALEPDDPSTKPTFVQRQKGIENPDPALHLAKDHGVYVMNNLEDQPDDLRDRVVYAEGFDPDRNPGWFERARRAVGGDDFVEEVPIQWVRIARKEEMDYLTISFTEDRIELVH